jgi:hypothetical protein
MSNIAPLPPVAPPLVSIPPVSAAPSTPDVSTDNSDNSSVQASLDAAAPATNATAVESPSVYTALANVSAPTIRGTTVNTAS